MTASILYLDIETAPNLAYVWGHYEQNVIEHELPWYIICAAWRWENERKVYSVAQIDDEKAFQKNNADDTIVVKKLWEILDKADIIIAHNGDRFDLRKIHARFAILGMKPPSPYRTIDTLKQARKHFAFNSNRLDDLGEILGLGGKTSHSGFAMWKGCMAGDEKAWRAMVRYNKRDITLLRDVYMALRPWIKNHPSIIVMGDAEDLDSCPTCGKDELMRRGYRYTNVSTFRQYLCKNCGAWPSTRLSEKIDRPLAVAR